MISISRSLAAVLFALAMLAVAPSLLVAQTQQVPIVMGVQAVPGGQGRSYPSLQYFASFPALNEGEYKTALDLFSRSLNSTYRVGQTRWIDSICTYTMVGECQYRLGNYAAALQNYEAALRLYMQYSDWLLRVQFNPSLTPSGSTRTAPWGRSSRGSRPAKMPETSTIAEGMSPQQISNALQGAGGRIAPPQFLTINVPEVIRCTCLAMQRRRDILGPLVNRYPLTDDVLAAASRRQGQPNHWSEAWLDVQQGIAYSIAGKSVQATTLLQRSLLMLGQYDHNLTGLALLELGNLSMQQGDYKTAAGYFEEATYTGYDFSDATTIEEGFRNLHLAHLLLGDASQMDQMLSLAAAWARSGVRELHASLLLMAAESLAVRGQTAQAVSILKDAAGNNIIGRRTMGACEIGSRLNWLMALTHYQSGAIPAGDAAMNSALTWYKNGGSKWLFQIALADNLCQTNAEGRFDRHVAMPLYAQILRDPLPSDWTLQPLDALTVMTTPHPLPFEHWFEIAVQKAPTADSAASSALEVADLVRRHRFLSSFPNNDPLGSRLLALRWVLEAPAEALDKETKLQRQELLTRYPKFAQADDKIHQLAAEIMQAGLNPDSHDALRVLTTKFSEIAALTATQENILHEMAVRRDPANVLFPPARRTKDIQAGLGPDQLMLMYFSTGRTIYGGFYSNDRCSLWKIDNPQLLEKRTVALLKGLGNYDSNKELQDAQLTDESWQPAARDLVSSLLSNPKNAFQAQYKELIIIPDGLLWYVPFEALPLGDPQENRTLISRMRVRYAPTAALSLGERVGRKATTDVGIVMGKLYPSQPAEMADDALTQLQRLLPHAVALRSPLPAISPLVGSVLDGLIVLDEIPAAGPYDWSPIPLDKNKNVGTLADWLALPWKNPDQFILPGFHTAAENGMKSAGQAPGNDLFLATTGLMAGGARTILLSRWRTGGQTALDLTREFVQELPFSTASEAWQRAVQLVSSSPLDQTHEPRIKRKPDAPPINADHPFFWAGYVLVDTGAAPQKEEKPTTKPVLKPLANNKQPDPKPAAPQSDDKKSADEKPSTETKGDAPSTDAEKN